MKLFLMTDLEGVAGVIDGENWLYPGDRCYDVARRLLTREVNAAIRGFVEGGFSDILVCDGHGAGAIDIERLDPRARLIRGWDKGERRAGNWPFGLDASFDAVAFVGQHAKAGTAYSHITHTGWFNICDLTVNGLSVGEYGQLALVAGEMGVPVVFASGEKALCEEVAALTPWVVTAAVLEGTIGGTGDELSGEAYERFHYGAIHLQPRAARQLIHDRALTAARLFDTHRDRFEPLKMEPPFRLVCSVRRYKGRPAEVIEFVSPSPLHDVFNERIAKTDALYGRV
jgi:D-amino peptidase